MAAHPVKTGAPVTRCVALRREVPKMDYVGLDPMVGLECASCHHIVRLPYSELLNNVLDAVDPFLAITGLAFGSEKNDGLVGVCSTYLGSVLGDTYNMNHVDAINHLFGLRGWTDPVSLYRQHANRLKNKGV